MKRLTEDQAKRKALREQKTRDRAYGAALDGIEKLEKQIEALKELRGAKSSYVIKPKATKGAGAEAVAVVCLSDWHVEEVVNPATVMGLNKYNPEIAKARATHLFQKVIRLVKKEQQDVSINHLVLWLGGDFISGNIHEELLENCAMPPVQAAMYAQELLYSGLAFLRDHFEGDITVVCNSGNHARMTRQVHISTEYGNSLETFIYAALKNRLEDMTWVIPEGYHAVIDVFGKKLAFNHGHYVKYGGGIGTLTVPLMKAIHGWASAMPDIAHTTIGHFHQYLQHRRFCVNGSLIGYSPFAIAIKAEYEPPCQAMFLWDKERGRSISIPILFN